jgi:glycolate oxidase FAD binding subunit
MQQLLASLIDQVQAAARERRTLCIRGGGSKDFYGNAPQGEVLDPRAWAGIDSYEPDELVITARAGTSLVELESVLAGRQQMLAFEPPHFGSAATVGGCIAAGLAGPRRSATGVTYGGVRDALLGARLLDGRGRVLRFGGTVMKNVAGYDVARVLAGSMGILGVLLEVSLKVLPRPAMEATLRFEFTQDEALRHLNAWGGEPLPLSASCWREGALLLRLSGSAAAVQHAVHQLGGEPLAPDHAAAFWFKLREQCDEWFAGDTPLWRLSVPSTAPGLTLAGSQTIEWGGALRWLRSSMSAEVVRAQARDYGGHATLFRGGDRSLGVFTPLASGVMNIHQRLKEEFDPARIFNPGRMYAQL